MIVSGLAVGLVTSVSVAAPADAATPPTVHNISPSLGLTSGGTKVSVTGSGFRHVEGVLFGSTLQKSVSVVSPTKLLVTSPRHAAGTVYLRVLTSAGRSVGVRAGRFTYGDRPTVTGIPYNQVPTPGAETIKVYGTHFGTDARVTVGAASAFVYATGSTWLTFSAPAHAWGPANVRVWNRFGTSLLTPADVLHYVVPPPFSLQAQPTDTQGELLLTWNFTSNAQIAGFTLCRLVGSTPPANPASGTQGSPGFAGEPYLDSELQPGTTYSYAVFAQDLAGHYSQAATLTVTA